MLTPEERWSIADLIMTVMAERSNAPDNRPKFRCVETIAGMLFIHDFERRVSRWGISTYHMYLTAVDWTIQAEMEFGEKVRMQVIGDTEICDTELMYVLFSGEVGIPDSHLLARLREQGVTTIRPS